MKKNALILVIILISIGLIVGITVIRNHNEPESIPENIVFSDIADIADYENDIPYFENITVLNYNEIDINNNIPMLVSFRIDDVDFSLQQRIVLENALYLAKKYNITFDLAVVARRFELNKNPDVYKIYEDNTDVFEIVAHGYMHHNPFIKNSSGEFYDKSHIVPYDIQYEHIKQMKEVFLEHNLLLATKVLILPAGAGDNNTIDIASKEGYSVVACWCSPQWNYYSNDTLVLRSMISIPLTQKLTDADFARSNNLLKYKKYGIKYAQVVLHTTNFIDITDTDKLLNDFDKIRKNDSDFRFVFISDTMS